MSPLRGHRLSSRSFRSLGAEACLGALDLQLERLINALQFAHDAPGLLIEMLFLDKRPGSSTDDLGRFFVYPDHVSHC